ncbi:helix-turn-helix transcriptional regulator [Pedobacter sp. MC2016-24]|uniref:helix-turn-helix transcriptional regulator n=1 Tax=Pedobacter sp. MC2016-24 TaxID=2780090 RepID=UPI001881568D|nr:helix-turn-helix transcriptional regulator [Pedobacter sp. MC2016-24]MBE9601674.1 helix-turn-helix transcriptional regulator [Pedobacter sp. MC2016-24]
MEIVNAGEIVELAIRRQNINISELSRRMHVNRRTLYNWFQQKELDEDVIQRIGIVINYDFTVDFHHELKIHRYHNDDVRQMDSPLNAEKYAPDSTYYWMEKYMELLKDYKKLLHGLKDYHH